MPANSKRWVITSADDLELCIEDIRAKSETPINDVAEFIRMDVCPVGLFTPLVIEAMRLYNLSQSRPLPWAINQEPAIYARCIDVIGSELAQINREQTPRDGK